MKRRLLNFVLLFCLFIPSVFLFTGCDDASKIDFRVSNGYIQYTSNGENWLPVIALSELKGEQGELGVDGREVEFRKTDIHIQWRFVDESQEEDENWEDLVLLSSLKGDEGSDGREVEFRKTEYAIEWRYVERGQGVDENWKFLVALYDLKGNDGADGSTWHSSKNLPPNDYEGFKHGDYFLHTTTSDIYKYYNGIGWSKIANINANIEKVEVSFDTNLPAYMYEFFDNYGSLPTKIIDKGSWCELENFSGSDLSRYFLGWYIGEGLEETKITSYTSISKNCTLKAKWDYEEIDKYYTSKGVEFSTTGFKNDGDPCTAKLTSECGEVVHIAEYWDDSWTYNGNLVARIMYVSDIINVEGATKTKELILPAKADIGQYIWRDDAFNGNNSIEKVSWFGEEKITNIGSYAFFNCKALKEVELPSSVTTIGNKAFAGCENLTTINLANIKSINEYAFADCSALDNINISVVETISEYAFYNCANLKLYNDVIDGIYITETVTSIGNNAFEGCVSLSKVYINSSIIANLTNDNSFLFAYASVIMIKKPITIELMAYLDDSQGHFIRQTTPEGNSHDILNKVVE